MAADHQNSEETPQKIPRIMSILLEEELVTDAQFKPALKIQSALEQEKQITDLSRACTRLGMNTLSGIVQTVTNENLYTSDNPAVLATMRVDLDDKMESLLGALKE